MASFSETKQIHHLLHNIGQEAEYRLRRGFPPVYVELKRIEHCHTGRPTIVSFYMTQDQWLDAIQETHDRRQSRVFVRAYGGGGLSGFNTEIDCYTNGSEIKQHRMSIEA